jgi:hypothetical protein
MKKTIFVICTICSTMYLTGQTIKWQELPFEKIPEISTKNDSLINKVQLPKISHMDNGLAYMITSTKLFYSRPDPESQKIEKEFERIANEYIIKNSIKDNGTRKERYAITKSGSLFQLSQHQTIKRYLFEEGAGVRSYISIDETPGYSYKQVFCIFNDNVAYSNTNIEFDTICSLTGDRIIIPNKRITYRDDQNNYEFIYSAILCTEKFQYYGLGTILPTFINLKLTIEDKKSGKTQTILQIPHDHQYKLTNILLGDINSDNKKDLILQIETDCCQERLIYLSGQDIKNGPFTYIGNMIIYCDYP